MEIDVKKIVGNNFRRLKEYRELFQIKFAEIIDFIALLSKQDF